MGVAVGVVWRVVVGQAVLICGCVLTSPGVTGSVLHMWLVVWKNDGN